jgi:hypothetical protein
MLALLGFILAVSANADIELVKDGKPAAEIVLDTNAVPGIKLAARDLQEHLEKMSGAKLEIVNAPSKTARNHVYVGENEFTAKLGYKLGDFKNSGFEIIAKDNYVILAGVDIQRSPTPFGFSGEGLKKWQEFCGEKFNYGAGGDIGIGQHNSILDIYTNDDLGTWYAVAELLEQLGVRFYAPYDNGTVIPEKKTIAVANQQLRKEAAFARREFCFYNAMRQDPEGIKWFKRIKLGNNNIIIFNHTTYDIYSSKEQKELHPEYLACDADGKPYQGFPTGAGMPRYTNPAFRKAAVNYMNKRFEADPQLTAISIGPPDGGIKMDVRDENLYGKPGDSLIQKASRYVWDFHVYLAKELKKSHPDKYLLYCSGGGANEVPENIEEFPDNIIVPFAQPYSAYMVLNSTERATLDLRKKWHAKMKTVKKAPIWDYYLYYCGYPVFFTEYLQKEMQECLPYCDGKFIEINPGAYKVEGEKNQRYRLDKYGLKHLMVYWQSKLFWDPDMDRKAMLEEYYGLFFGPAKAEMKEFHEFAEEVWCRQESRSVTETTGFLKEKDVERYFEILKRARDKAGKDTVYDKRIAQMESEMASLRTFFASLKRTGPKVEAHVAPGPVKIDGNLNKYPAEWRVTLRNNATGELPVSNKTEAVIAMPPDCSALIIGVICHEDQMDKIKSDCKLNDTFNIFDDDVVEVYVNTPERSYFKVAVNPDCVIWDESTDATIVDRDTLPVLWNPGTEAVVKKDKDRWTVEIKIPTKDMGTSKPTESKPWGIQVGRTRFTGDGGGIGWSIAPTAGPYRTLNKWGDLYVK